MAKPENETIPKAEHLFLLIGDGDRTEGEKMFRRYSPEKKRETLALWDKILREEKIMCRGNG